MKHKSLMTIFAMCVMLFGLDAAVALGAIADVKITPSTLNLNSKGKWINCQIRLPGYYVEDVDTTSILLQGLIAPDRVIVDIDEQVINVKFNRSSVQELFTTEGQYELTVSGMLIIIEDPLLPPVVISFSGTDTIKVIDKGKKK